MPVTIKDIAREIGISASTVSRILNDKTTQNKELIRLVKAKAKELNYQVNTAAVGLRTNKTKLIGIVVPEINDDFFAEILSGVEEAAEANGYNLLICQSHESASKEMKLIKSLIACNVEGMLISASIESSETDDIESEVLRAGKKMVFFDRVPAKTNVPSVTIQDYEGAKQMALHVAEKGRKKPVYLGFSQKLSNDHERLKGIVEGFQSYDITLAAKLYDEQIEQLPEIIESEKVDAIVCYNDNLAARAIKVLKQAGINMPGDVAISGFDNRAICELLSPQLTSVNHSTKDLGKTASELLLTLLNDEEKEVENVVLPASIVERESTK